MPNGSGRFPQLRLLFLGRATAGLRGTTVTLSIQSAFIVLAAVQLNDQVPFSADKIGVIAADRLLAHEFEPTELATADTLPKE